MHFFNLQTRLLTIFVRVQKGYTCHIAHICLNTLETRYHKNPPSSEPFELLIPYTFEDPVHDATVFVLGSALYISVVLLPGEVVIINVGTSEARSLICEPDPSYDVFVSTTFTSI